MLYFFDFEDSIQDNSSHENVSQAICDIIHELMDSVMEKVLVKAPFIPEKHHAEKPLYAALVPDEIFKGSHFERRFVTPFGNAWEKLAMAVGKVHHGECTKGTKIEGTILEGRLKRIQEVLNRLDHPEKGKKKEKPNWDEELAYVMAGRGKSTPITVVCDILVNNKTTGKKYAFELKGPLADKDQTKVSKEKILKLMAMDGHPVDGAYFALTYNPFIKRELYKWGYVECWFNIEKDKSILIGDEFWNMIGGEGTYKLFIDEVNKLGAYYKEMIYREYLGIEPPVGIDAYTLK